MQDLKQIKGLDTLRAFAVILVLIGHLGPYYSKSEAIGYFIKSIILPDATFGVYLFFVLSVFLITSILLNARIESNDINRISIVKNFFMRRALRIFPIYYLLIFILYFMFDDIKGHLGYLLTYTVNMYLFKVDSWVASSATHTWTLSVEEQFYLIWPWIVLYVNRRYLKYIFIIAVIFGAVSTYLTLKIKMAPWLTINCMDGFGIGGFYAYARLDSERCRVFEKNIKRLIPFVFIPYFFWRASVYTNNQFGISFRRFVYSIINVWLIVLVVNNRSELLRRYLLENRILNYIGKISYGIYLYHAYIYRLNPWMYNILNQRFGHYPIIHDALISASALYIYDLIILYCLCWLSFNFIEKPILHLKRFFDYSTNKQIKPHA